MVRIDFEPLESSKIADFVRWQMEHNIWPYLGGRGKSGTYVRWFHNEDKAVITEYLSNFP